MSERGSMMPLFGGAIVLLLTMVTGVAVATSLLIERQRLYSLADGAAVFASESFDPAFVSKEGLRIRAPLDSFRVQQSAEEFLAKVGSHALSGVVLESASTSDGWRAHVELSSVWVPPIVSDFFPAPIRLFVEARAQTILR